MRGVVRSVFRIHSTQNSREYCGEAEKQAHDDDNTDAEKATNQMLPNADGL